MRGTYRLFRIFGINIDIHVTFFLLLGFFFLVFGFKGLVLILGVFLFVTIHELCHSLMALHFGIKVKRITLLPIGGVASMSQVPAKAYQELLISLAGPLSNLAVIVIFYYPLRMLLGQGTLMYPLLVIIGQAKYAGDFNVIAHIYWINLVLAAFNMIPAFPMDGGRILRAILSYRMGHRGATAVAVRLGHIFALLFAYLGIVYGHIFLLLIAVFIYMSASGEAFQVEVVETIKRYSVQDVLSESFAHVSSDAPLSKVLELMFHSHQEDFPVIDEGVLKGFITKREIIGGMHQKGSGTSVREVMRTDIPAINSSAKLNTAQGLMQKYNTTAMPVERNGGIVGVITLNDINRIFTMMHEK